jgi:hypothetical protein
MTREEFKALKPRAVFRHPAYGTGLFVVASIETDYDFSTKPATTFTDAITTTDGRRMKIDDHDVALCQLVSNPQ